MKMSSTIIASIFLLMPIIKSTILVANAAPSELNEQEIKIINQFSENVAIEDAIGQLLIIGAAGDTKNYPGNPRLEEQIATLGVGGVMLNSYNYEKQNDSELHLESINSIIGFHNHLQSLSDKSKLKLPIFLAADFEGPSFTSFPGAVIQPPPALTLASTANAKLIRLNGKAVGFQLSTLGINMLLGPVLDIDRSTQGDADKTIKNRSFGGSPDRVYNSASHFVTGIREAGVLSIAKHFPGLGSVIGSMHSTKKFPTYYGGASRLKQELLPYKNFSKYLDGIMTSHVYLDFLEADKQQPITFSKLFVTNLLQKNNPVLIKSIDIPGLNFSEKLILSDDLTDMGSIIQYRKKYNKSHTDIAIEALESGHDMLIFSHVELPNTPKRGINEAFHYNDLKTLVSELTLRIQNNERLEKRFRSSLKKIIYYKATHNKKLGGSTSEMLLGIRGAWIKQKLQNIDDLTKPEFLKRTKHKDIKDLVKITIDNATIKLHEISKDTANISDLNSDTNIHFYIEEDYIDNYKIAFAHKFKSSQFFPICKSEKHTKNCTPRLHSRGKLNKALEASLKDKSVDKIIFTALNIDDMDSLEKMRLDFKPKALEKIILLIHYTPTIISKELSSRINIYGNFTKHSLSFKSDIDLLNGEINPKNKDQLPINFGGNPDALNENPIKINPAKGFEPIKYYATAKEKQLTLEIESLKEKIIEQEKLKQQEENIKKKKDPIKQQENKKYNHKTTLQWIIIALAIAFLILTAKIYSKRNGQIIERKEGLLSRIHDNVFSDTKVPALIILSITLTLIAFKIDPTIIPPCAPSENSEHPIFKKQ
ncbi:glycoside hydrolase family 3 N-terminal domain-containing protein [Marinagarivorans cellulosilyticus]|uniref:beta-N-acetylhexosaminidase n=1 Tax=Marinagarivorans cellulosilyticus TaxID=2721545 RepID=A0AAN1WGH2_9GAMM|nr:glycoside hydrolase family 3 N-terminal domain-containing protein [Marinagarivorans cellulosilyticus]BCD97164.1 beta-N-acetylhexosaminidase [Marinagarivorans cellulosilyticus]